MCVWWGGGGGGGGGEGGKEEESVFNLKYKSVFFGYESGILFEKFQTVTGVFGGEYNYFTRPYPPGNCRQK